MLGQPIIIRKDGKTISARFDSDTCRLFVFMNATITNPKIEHFELRNKKGELINRQKDIESCFNKIKSV